MRRRMRWREKRTRISRALGAGTLLLEDLLQSQVQKKGGDRNRLGVGQIRLEIFKGGTGERRSRPSNRSTSSWMNSWRCSSI